MLEKAEGLTCAFAHESGYYVSNLSHKMELINIQTAVRKQENI